MAQENLSQQNQQDFQKTQQVAPITCRKEYQELYSQGNPKKSNK